MRMRGRIAGLSLHASFLVLAAGGCAGTAFAQDRTEDAGDPRCAQITDPELRAQCVLEAKNGIVVTGSRIPRAEFETTNPVQSLTAERIEQSGKTNLTDFLATTPALQGSSTSQVGANLGTGVFGLQGLNALDLRNLGLARTLVLVNGRRHVSGDPVTSAVDIGSIPMDLVERVDVLTGGASAIYGADAVAGVVNFVLKRNFEGIKARGQIGITDRGAAGERYGSIVAGHNFAGGRGNIALAYEYSASDRLDYRQRGFNESNFKVLTRDANDIPDDPNKPDNILFSDVRWIDSPNDSAVDLGSFVNGVFVPGAFDDIPDFTGSGLPYDRGRVNANGDLVIADGSRTVGGSSVPIVGYNGDILPSVRRHNANVLASFEVSPAFRLFAEGKYSYSRTYTVRPPTFISAFLQPDNVFARQRFGALASEGASIVDRENFDLGGLRATGARRDVYRGVIGAEGKLSDHLRYEVSYVYGESDIKIYKYRELIRDRFRAAIDAVVNPATGQPTCRVNLDPNAAQHITFQPGECVPLNILGFNVASPAAIDFVTLDYASGVIKMTQNVAHAHIAGDLGFLFNLPGGPIGFAAGVEYRKETSRTVRHPYEQQGLIGGVFRNVAGKYDVREAFAEANIPLLKDLPFAQELSFGGAVRVSDYSTVGNTVAWKLDGLYAPVRDITFRGTLSQAVRAPNIQELFAPQANTFLTINDPCHFENRTSGTSYRVANCQAALAAAGLSTAQIAAFTGIGPRSPGFSGGNPNLKEETARTWTAGVVLRPRFLPGFTASADWYNIKLRDAIETASAQQLVELCVDQPTLNNIFCQHITRAQGTGIVSSFLTGPANVRKLKTDGLDVTLNYRFSPSPGLGTFNLRLVGEYLHSHVSIAIPGAQPFDDAGDPYRPKYSGTFNLTWYKGPLTVNYGLTWFSRTRRVSELVKAARPDFSDPSLFWYKQRWTHDIRVAYDVDKRFTLYAGVNDFLNQKPSPAAESVDPTYPGTAQGRFLYVGAKINLDRLGDIF